MQEYIILLFLFAIVLVCIITTMIISSGCRYCFQMWCIEQTNNEYIVSSNTKNELRRNEDTKK